MSITQFTSSIKTVVRSEGNATIPSTWQGRFNWIENTAAMVLTLSTATNLFGDFEIIIRNSYLSTDIITLAMDGYTADVSSDLGLSIPPGGIVELKRIGSSTTVSVYGYIAA